jgi:hypothetical protein
MSILILAAIACVVTLAARAVFATIERHNAQKYTFTVLRKGSR